MEQTNSLAYQRAYMIIMRFIDRLDSPAIARAKLEREGLRCTAHRGHQYMIREDLTGRTFTITV